MAVVAAIAAVKARGGVAAPAAPDAAASVAALPAAEPASRDAEPEGLIATYGARRIALNRLKAPTRRLMWIAVAQIILVAVLMALQRLRQPLVNSAVPGTAGGTLAVPLVVFVVMVISIMAGYWFGLAGALRVRPAAGLLIAALATWTLGDEPVSLLRLGATSIDPRLSDAGLRWAQIGVLAGFWVWLGCLTAARWRTRTAAPPDPDGQPWHPAIFWGALACVFSYYALELAIWVLYTQAGQTATGTGSLLQDLGVQAVLLPTFLVLVVLLGSTDLLEWGEIAVQSIVRGTRYERPRWLLGGLTLLAALATIANVIRLDGTGVLAELAVIGIPAALLAALVRSAPGFGDWSADIRSRAVLIGATATFIFITILLTGTSVIREAIGWSAGLDGRFYSLVSIPIALAALTGGLVLLADARMGKPEQRGRGLLLVIAGGLITIAGLPAFLAGAHLPAALLQHRFSPLNGLQAVAAAGALGWLASLAVRRRRAGPPAWARQAVTAGQLASVLALLAGLQIVSWVLDLLNAITRLGADSDYLLGALFFVTVFWGFAMSGDKLTGEKANTAGYPRDGRILLTVSYTLISTATLLYLGALRAAPNAGEPPDYLTADPVTPLGLAVLGSAVVIVAFVARMSNLPGTATVPEVRARPAVPARPAVRARIAVRAGIAVGGAAATGAALVVLGSALPQLTRASAALLSAPYTAAVPGPGCDTGGALWTVTPGEPITTTCGAAGLLVQIGPGPNIEADVKFLPQGGYSPESYRVSVTVTFGRSFNGCAGIFTRGSSAGRYLTVVCDSGSVEIDRFTAHGSALIYLNFVHRAPAYTIAAVAAGPEQSVYLDGTRVGTVADAALPQTEYVGLGILNGGSKSESAMFSTFSFTPIPHRA